MAEAATTEDREGALPEKGKVESVCKKWLVHEDGVLAYKLQNEEMDFHYGLNRYNRRTVREDIPVAKLVQSEEEIRQQRERMEQLMLLKTQAEEDEKVAASVMREIDMEDAVHKMQSELHDEDYARKMQEKEKRRFERWHREQELKKERLRLEQELARHSEEARLVINKDDGGHTRQPSGDTDNVSHETEASPVARVTSGGRIEDDGDFSDFYIPPAEHMEEGEKKQLQELQDEELARLLQEQEHKRTKAEVDQDKLRQIEQQDAQLARIIHEQDKLKAKKAKQRKQKSMDEARRQRSQHEAQRSQSVDEGVRGGVDMTPGGVGDPVPPRSPHSSAGTPGSQRSYRDQNGSYEEHLSQRISPASPQSPQQGQIRSPPLYEHHHHRESPPPLPQQSAHEVERWLTGNHSQPHSQSPPSSSQRAARRSHDQQRIRQSPSPPGSFHSEDSAHETHRPQLSQSNSLSQQEPSPVPFNIAMAIDPTYRASPQDAHQMGRTREAHPPVTQSHSYPATTGHTVYEDEPEEDYDQDDPNWAPVQGQRRTNIERGKKVGKKTPKKGSSCKQQ